MNLKCYLFCSMILLTVERFTQNKSESMQTKIKLILFYLFYHLLFWIKSENKKYIHDG